MNEILRSIFDGISSFLSDCVRARVCVSRRMAGNFSVFGLFSRFFYGLGDISGSRGMFSGLTSSKGFSMWLTLWLTLWLTFIYVAHVAQSEPH